MIDGCLLVNPNSKQHIIDSNKDYDDEPQVKSIFKFKKGQDLSGYLDPQTPYQFEKNFFKDNTYKSVVGDPDRNLKKEMLHGFSVEVQMKIQQARDAAI